MAVVVVATALVTIVAAVAFFRVRPHDQPRGEFSSVNQFASWRSVFDASQRPVHRPPTNPTPTSSDRSGNGTSDGPHPRHAPHPPGPPDDSGRR